MSALCDQKQSREQTRPHRELGSSNVQAEPRSALGRLQASAGNRAVAALLGGSRIAVQRQQLQWLDDYGVAPLREGAGPSTNVGRLQQKLNAVGAATPPLHITAVYGPETTAAVRQYQRLRSLPMTGWVDRTTWVTLEREAREVVEGGRLVIPGPRPGEPLGTPTRETRSMHPTLQLGAHGPAVEELQQRLNNTWARSRRLVVHGGFTPDVRHAVIDFQRSVGIHPANGVVGPATWAQLDRWGTTSVGRISFRWDESHEGRRPGMLSRYSWRLGPGRMSVTVNLRFTGASNHSRVEQWLRDITSIWNVFKIVNDSTPPEEIHLDFRPVRASPPDVTIRVVADSPERRARGHALRWHTGDLRRSMAPHEFGHLIGLEDEYNRPEEAFVETTGEQAPVGAITATSGASPERVAQDIRAAATGPPRQRAERLRQIILTQHGLSEGAFARRVDLAYQRLYAGHLHGRDIADDLAWRIPGHRPQNEQDILEPFLYTTRSLMGGMESVEVRPVPFVHHPGYARTLPAHDHPVLPRHVRQFVEIVQRMRGGRWRAERR